MHIYRLNDTEWWMAPSLEEAITAAMEQTHCAREDVADTDARQLTDEELDSMQFVDADEPGSEEPSEGWPSRTFREELAQRVAAGCGAEVFATTEW
jgi:hypothetical protein